MTFVAIDGLRIHACNRSAYKQPKRMQDPTCIQQPQCMQQTILHTVRHPQHPNLYCCAARPDRARTATAAASAMAVFPAPVGAHTSTELPARNFCTASFWKRSNGNWNVSSISPKVRLLLADRMRASICTPHSLWLNSRNVSVMRCHEML